MPGCWSPYIRPTFLSIFPWSPLGKISENCWSPYSRPTFLGAFSLAPPLAKSQKMADLGLLGKFVITRLYGHLWRFKLQKNVPLSLQFKCILVRRWCDLRQGVLEARIVGLLFWAFSLGPPLAKSQKMADLGLLGKFVITHLFGHLWRRKLHQNVPLWLHFKRILIRRWCDFAPGCFWSPYSRPTFLSIFPWSALGKISENGRFRSPLQICHNSALQALMEAQVAAKYSSMIAH